MAGKLLRNLNCTLHTGPVCKHYIDRGFSQEFYNIQDIFLNSFSIVESVYYEESIDIIKNYQRHFSFKTC